MGTLAAQAATGDIVSAKVTADGIYVDVAFSGFTASNLYDFHLTSVTNIFEGRTNVHYKPSSTTPSLTVFSPGFDSTGTSNWTSRTVYVVNSVRKAYPDHAQNQETEGGGNVTNRMLLAETVCVNDGAITMSMAANTYSNNNAVTGLSVVNNSTEPYYQSIANWTDVGWQQMTGTTFRVRAVGFSGSAKDGQPLALMRFIARDGTSTITNDQTEMKIDYTLPDPRPTAEYYADFTLASFVDHSNVRFDFIAFPHRGRTNEIFSTTWDTYTGMTPLPTSITNLSDKDNDYSTFIAVVEKINGVDADGRATNVALGSVNSAHYFKTITAAWNAVTASNNCCAPQTTHNTPGGGKVAILTTAVTGYVWTEGTLSAGAQSLAACWAETFTYPGNAPFIITNRVDSRNVGHRTKISGATLAWEDPAVPFNAIGALWFDRCNWNSSGSSAGIQSVTNVFLTWNNATNFGQGLRGVNNQDTAFRLVRGCNLNYLSADCLFYTWVGNERTLTNGASFSLHDAVTGSSAPQQQYGILYNNRLTFWTDNPSFSIGASHDVQKGVAIVQNIFERCATDHLPVVGLVSSGNNDGTNVLVWHNAFLGERVADVFSSQSETTTIWRKQCEMRNNIWDLCGFKKDTEAGGEDADRIGNWQPLQLVDGSGNIFTETTVNSAAAGFPPIFRGLYNSYPANTNNFNYAQFVNRAAYSGGAGGSGGGNYKTLSYAPGLQMMVDWVLPFDIEGNRRGKSDPVGPYSSASPRKGSGFFQ